MRRNPFTPSFGTLPAVLVGREEVLAGVSPLFEHFRKTDIHWATHLRAHRGAGKTVLLDQIQDAATNSGWWVLQEDAGAGAPLTARIINRSLARLDELIPPSRARRVTGVTILGTSLSMEPSAPMPATVTSVRDVLDALVRAERHGVLVTIDEAHQASDAVLNEIGNAAQHLHRDGQPLVFVMAGLPRPERAKEPTFLSRAWQPSLGPLSDADIERGLVATAATAGGTFQSLGLRHAVELSAGEPFLMQLVGYHAWDGARRSPITAGDVRGGAPAALGTYRRSVTSQMVAGAPAAQRAFLASMARIGTPARMSDIRAECGWSTSQGGVYRQRLLDAGLIVAVGHGLVDFAIPGVGDVLLDDV